MDEPKPEPAPPISEPKPGTDWQREREAFGARLRKAREATGLDKQAFAARIGAYKATYSAWENGDIRPSRQKPELPIGWWLRLPPEPEKGEKTS